MKAVSLVLTVVFSFAASVVAEPPPAVGTGPLAEDGLWVHSGKTSAVICWRLNDISRTALGFVEYGPTADYGKKTEPAKEPRWQQCHRLTGLEAGKTYHFRTVILDGGKKVAGKDNTFTTNAYAGAVEITVDASGKPDIAGGVKRGGNFDSAIILNKPDTTYVLAGDVKADGSGIEIGAAGVTLELDGHTVEFSRDSKKQVFGVIPNAPNAKVYNGRIVQGESGADFGYAFAGRRGVDGLEAAGIYCEVHRPNAYPMSLFGLAKGKIALHHNEIYSTVTTIQSRHYPGNDLLRVDPADGAEVEINDNLLTEGCHRGITFHGDKPAKSASIHHNDIRHHMQFTNGYAFNGNLEGAKIFRNRISSVGRTAHLTAPRIEFYENWASTKGHMELSDMPQGSGKWNKDRIELHGIKLEGKAAREIKVHDNYMRIDQPQPDGKWDYVPCTPLNIGAEDPNAMNEVYNNTFVAMTSYKKTRHGGYGDSGQWAAGIFFVTGAGATDEGKYFVWIHDNQFISNDLFIGDVGYGKLNPKLGIRIEKNTFTLAEDHTDKPAVFYKIPPELQEKFKAGKNTFKGMEP